MTSTKSLIAKEKKLQKEKEALKLELRLLRDRMEIIHAEVEKRGLNQNDH